MGMCIQNEIVRDGFVQHCPRRLEATGGESGLMEVGKCQKKCRFHRGYVASVSVRGEYQKGTGWPSRKVEVLAVTCEYRHSFDLGGNFRNAVTCG